MSFWEYCISGYSIYKSSGDNKDIPELFIVISLSFSSSLKSIYKYFPFIFLENILFDEISASESEVLPWSTCAIIHMLYIFYGYFWSC